MSDIEPVHYDFSRLMTNDPYLNRMAEFFDPADNENDDDSDPTNGWEPNDSVQDEQPESDHAEPADVVVAKPANPWGMPMPSTAPPNVPLNSRRRADVDLIAAYVVGHERVTAGIPEVHVVVAANYREIVAHATLVEMPVVLVGVRANIDVESVVELAARHGVRNVVALHSPKAPMTLLSTNSIGETANRLGIEVSLAPVSISKLEKAKTAEQFGHLIADAERIARPLVTTDSVSDDPTDSLDDTGLAARIVAAHGKQLRYVRERKSFVYYQGGRWTRFEDRQIYELIDAVVTDIRKAGPGSNDHGKWRTFTDRIGNTKSQQAALEKVKGHRAVSVSANTFDANPDMLNVLNGTVDLLTGKLKPHDAADLLHRQAPVTFDPDATCPTWEQALNLSLAPYGDDRDAVKRVVQQVCGYALSGRKNLKAMPYLWGARDSGKSTFVSILQDTLGLSTPDGSRCGYYASTRVETFLRSGRDNRFALGDIDGVRLLTADEMPGDATFNTAFIKTLTGGRDTVTVERKGEQPYSVRPQLVPWLFGNSKPIVADNDPAFFNRLLVIGLPETVPEDKRDLQLADKLQAELSGILNWMIAGLLDLRRTGTFIVPACIGQARDEYSQETPIARFVADCCYTQADVDSCELKLRPYDGDVDGPDMRLFGFGSTLYAMYTSWTKVNGQMAVQSARFFEQLKQAGYEVHRTKNERNNFLGITPNGSAAMPNPEYAVRPRESIDRTVFPKPMVFNPKAIGRTKTSYADSEST